MAATKNGKAHGTTKPKQDFNIIGQAALKAQALAEKYKAEIGSRLSADFHTAFASDIDGLGAAVPAAINSKGGAVQLTAAQRSALEGGHQLVMGIRTTVKGHTGDEDVLLAYGVGARMSKYVVKDVTASLQKILDRVADHPDEATAFEIVDEDVKALVLALNAIKDADKLQEAARAAAPQTTKERNATARRLLDGIKKIAGAGMRAFAGKDATAYASFEALVSKKAG